MLVLYFPKEQLIQARGGMKLGTYALPITASGIYISGRCHGVPPLFALMITSVALKIRDHPKYLCLIVVTFLCRLTCQVTTELLDTTSDNGAH